MLEFPASVGKPYSRGVSKLVVGSSDRTVWTGRPGSVKAVAWSDAIPLDGVKRVARGQGATVNDVLVAALAGALKSYLAGRGDDVEQRQRARDRRFGGEPLRASIGACASGRPRVGTSRRRLTLST